MAVLRWLTLSTALAGAVDGAFPFARPVSHCGHVAASPACLPTLRFIVLFLSRFALAGRQGRPRACVCVYCCWGGAHNAPSVEPGRIFFVVL